MTRFITNIKKKSVQNDGEDGISVAILAAGTGSKIKSYEPRSLLKIQDKNLIYHQIDAIKNTFNKVEIITVVGCHANKVIKKIRNKSRIVENQLHDKSNSSESLRLAFNNSLYENFMFIHGDILFNKNCLKVDYTKSFVIVDSGKMIKDQEIGITSVNDQNKEKKKLSFEIINEVIEQGGVFECYEPKNMKIKEIDRIKDIEE
jgi:choline kinase